MNRFFYSIFRSVLFSFFLVNFSFLFNSPSGAFDYFEHRIIGNTAYKKAKSQVESNGNQENRNLLADFLKKVKDVEKELEFGQLRKDCESGFPASWGFDRDAQLACHFLNQVPFTFGDLTALAGDHFESPEELQEVVPVFSGQIRTNDKDESGRILATRRQWLNACRWYEGLGESQTGKVPNFVLERIVKAEREIWRIKDMLKIAGPSLDDRRQTKGRLAKGEQEFFNLRQQMELANRPTIGGVMLEKCFREKSEALDSSLSLTKAVNGNQSLTKQEYTIGSQGYSPSRTELGEFERLTNYKNLVQRNGSHFPRHSWKEYLTRHFQALQAAWKFAQNRERTDHLTRAMVYEGFAQHFLHDSFSSGHIGAQYGSCILERPLALGCHPPKVLLQHTHDVLNAVGLSVVTQESAAKVSPGSNNQGRDGWMAFGDQHLMIPEAADHRAVLIKVATDSISEIFQVAMESSVGKENDKLLNGKLLCEKWKAQFPVPSQDHDVKGDNSLNCDSYDFPLNNDEDLPLPNSSQVPQDLAKFRVQKPFWTPQVVWNTFEKPLDLNKRLGRSTNPWVPDLPLEGWKILVTWGPTYGPLDELNSDGSLLSVRNSTTGGSFELGYIRSTDILFNYLGFGAFIVPGTRISVYPLSVGSWFSPPSRKFFLGVRGNLGVRIIKRFQQENPNDRIRTPLEFSLPVDFAYAFYPPASFYIRSELLTFIFNGLNERGPLTNIRVDSLFIGRGSITFGFAMDLAGIF
ncbi:MAG: hypothetical protein IH977_12195 [Nitrospinae bacterium]|nr:hypothetical protein [Nitrospinota bacterium]